MAAAEEEKGDIQDSFGAQVCEETGSAVSY